jgi:cytochrome b561
VSHPAQLNDLVAAAATDDGAYGTPAIALRWIIALLIFGGIGLGLFVTDIRAKTLTKLKLYSYQKWVGITASILAALRVVWHQRGELGGAFDRLP